MYKVIRNGFDIKHFEVDDYDKYISDITSGKQITLVCKQPIKMEDKDAELQVYRHGNNYLEVFIIEYIETKTESEEVKLVC